MYVPYSSEFSYCVNFVINPSFTIFYFNFLGRGLFASGEYDALNIKPGFDKDMTLLAYFKKSNPSKAVSPSFTGPLSLRMPSFYIELARWPTNAWQKSWREKATHRPSRPQNQPNEERMISTHSRGSSHIRVTHRSVCDRDQE